VAGPMSAPDGWQWEQNIRNAEQVGFTLIKLGASAVVPQTMGRFFRGTLSHEAWMDADLSLLKRCDACVVLPKWEESTGTRLEVRFCRDNEIPMFFLVAPEWLPIELVDFLGVLDDDRDET
jgi:hypothetical protein